MARTSDAPAPGGAILPETHHAFLRRTTRSWHEQVDAAYAAHELATREGLSRFLQQQARALASLERRIEECGAAAMLPDWMARTRQAALAADLAHLGCVLPPPVALAPFRSRLHGLGALYVLEGSKLGARVLLRTVANSHAPAIRAATRFLGHPNDGGWARFLAMLNGLPTRDDVRIALHGGALAAFAAFLHAAKTPRDIGRVEGRVDAPALSIPVKRETAKGPGRYAG